MRNSSRLNVDRLVAGVIITTIIMLLSWYFKGNCSFPFI